MNTRIALVLCIVGAILVAAGGHTRRSSRICLVAPVLLLGLPAFVDADSVARGAFAFAVLVIFASAIDFAFGPRPATPSARGIYLVAFSLFIDTIHVQNSKKRFDRQGTLQILTAIAAALFVFFTWRFTDFACGAARFVARTLLVALFVFALEELTTGAVSVASTAAGRILRPLHDAPYLSTSIGEFWSRRWNLLMAGWLRRHCFSPIARYGTVAALFATFVASAALHGYLFLSIDLTAAFSWAAFFLMQPPLLIAERQLRVKRWPAPLARVWTIGWLVALLPLLAWPLLAVLNTSF